MHKTFRPLPALCLALVAALLAAPAEAGSLTVRYGASLMGIPFGEVVANLHMEDNTYRADGRAKATGITRVFSDARIAFNADGVMKNGAPEARHYWRRWREEDDDETVSLDFSAGRLTDHHREGSKPEKEYADRVPVREADKKGVLDPITALVMPIAGRSGQALCDNRAPIFEDQQRFDLTMRFLRTERFSGGRKNYSGPAVVCQVRYTPIAGHRSGKKTVAEMAANTGMEVWLAPIEELGLLVPVKAKVPTTIGVIEAEAERVYIN
ncbi:DUF3108 domain-containing protein [Afifella sp. IM 167]|uniref:DUF3108 domain-containing protein n=1 Tax=Afifella sp. IM 167 TaxID=2033586 RepID=UPI001CCF4A51|nr:DUF3108 domain-containing protein [Afifella sp. IM 167]